MQLPFAQGIDPDSGTNALMAGAKLAMEKRKQAADLLLGQQRLGLDQARLNAENSRAEAESRRADAASRREDRMASMQERQARIAGATAVLPYLDPNSQQFNPSMAQQIAGAHGISMTQAPSNVPEPGPVPQVPQAPSFVGPIDTPEHARSVAQQQASSTMSPQDGPVLPRMREMGDQAASEAMQQQAERDQYAQQLSEAPKRQAEYSGRLQQYQQAKQFPTFNLDMGTGQPLTVDTGAMHQQAESSRHLHIQKYSEAYGDNPEAMKVAVPMAAMGIPDEKITAAVNEVLGKKAGLQNKIDEDAKYKLPVDEQIRLREMEARARLMSAQAGVGSKEDAASARAQALLEKKLADADKTVDWKSLQSMDTTMRSLLANASDPNALNHRDAQIQLAKVFRGTTPTEGEMHLLYNNLGGTADKLNQWVSAMESGDLSAEQMRQLGHSANVANEELEKRKERAFKSIKTSLGPGSGFEMMAPQVNAAIKARGDAVGVDVPDLYNTSGMQEQAVLGSRAKKQARTTGANPLTRAAKIGRLNPAQRATYDKAQKVASDPTADPALKAKAQAVIQAVEGG